MSENYSGSGVDTAAADAWVEGLAARFTAGLDADEKKRLISGIGDYASIYALSEEQWIATSCDGVGTKILWTQQGLGRPEDLAQDLVAMNANDLICVGARPALFLDYLAVGSKKLLSEGGLLDRFMKGLATACASTGQIVAGGETAQMPDIYGDKGFDMAGFCVGFLKPEERLGIENVKPGMHLYGWDSSGPHSNGYSWLRKLFTAPADEDFIRDALMLPTRLYVNDFLRLRKTLKVAAAWHITGSGLLNLLRAQPAGRKVGFELTQWPAAEPWLDEIKKRTLKSVSTGLADLYTAFNMGVGFVVAVDPAFAESGAALLESARLRPLGRVIDEPVVKVDGLVLE